jgi:hypothetical protein
MTAPRADLARVTAERDEWKPRCIILSEANANLLDENRRLLVVARAAKGWSDERDDGDRYLTLLAALDGVEDLLK